MDNAKELTTAQRRLVSWLATPETEREPRTLDALASEIGVRPATIQRWRTHKLDAIATKKARMRLLEHLPGVYQTLARKAEDGSHEHIGLFLSIIAGQPRGECKELEPIGGTGDDKYASK
jgi:DNA-binding MurR/RpiR family transcriptional regulator